MNQEAKTKEKKKGVMRFHFPYGHDEWDFAYVTLFFLKQICLVKLIQESNTEQLKVLEHFGAIKLCADTQKARINKLDISVDPAQVIPFIKKADELSDLMTQREGTKFTAGFLKSLRTKHKRFRTAKELEVFYLSYSTGFIKMFNEHYKDSELEDVLKTTWG